MVTVRAGRTSAFQRLAMVGAFPENQLFGSIAKLEGEKFVNAERQTQRFARILLCILSPLSTEQQNVHLKSSVNKAAKVVQCAHTFELFCCVPVLSNSLWHVYFSLCVRVP